jgi:uncharacterized protein YprB with RNaseH-like and TPR domain
MIKNNFGLIMESWRGYKKLSERKEYMKARTFKEALDYLENELSNTTLIFFDTETTGLHAVGGDTIVEIAIVDERGKVLINTSSFLF